MDTAQKRLMNKLLELPNGCWGWGGYTDRLGYGRINIDGKIQKTHRISFRIFNGEIPDGKVIDHLCSNRSCFNPNHLEAVTQKENIYRSEKSVATIHKMKTHCIRGHRLSGANLRIYKKRNERVCKQCHRDSNKKGGY